jgi:hypothetical protein
VEEPCLPIGLQVRPRIKPSNCLLNFQKEQPHDSIRTTRHHSS